MACAECNGSLGPNGGKQMIFVVLALPGASR